MRNKIEKLSLKVKREITYRMVERIDELFVFTYTLIYNLKLKKQNRQARRLSYRRG